EGEDDAPGARVTGRVVERFQPDQQEVAAERQRQLRCGPLARGAEPELDIVAREEAFTVLHEPAGQLLEGRSARVQRPDDVGERAPQLLRGGGDFFGDPALLTLVESAGREEPGENADAAEAGAELVVQV